MTSDIRMYIEEYLTSIKNSGVKLTQGSLVSGLCCLVTFYSIHPDMNPTAEQQTKIRSYVLLYLHVDYYLDSPHVSNKDKAKLIMWLKDVNRDTRISAFHSQIHYLYTSFVKTDKDKKLFDRMIDITIESSAVQYNKKASKKQLNSVCRNKGGLTLLVGCRIIYGSELNHISDSTLMLLGECIQLLDDIADCSADVRNGINTSCVLHRRKHIYLDYMAGKLAVKSKGVCDVFPRHQKALMFLLLCCIDRSSNFSPYLRVRLKCSRYKLEKHKRSASASADILLQEWMHRL